jgi:hypothetical protein
MKLLTTFMKNWWKISMRVIVLSLFIFLIIISMIRSNEEKVGNPNDVPVVQPKKPEDTIVPPKTETKAIEEQALLPIGLVKNRLDTLKVGSNAYINVMAVRVDERRKCWLHPQSITGNKSIDKVIQVRHDTDGYHLVIDKIDHQWEAQEIDGSLLRWIPVKTIVIRE